MKIAALVYQESAQKIVRYFPKRRGCLKLTSPGHFETAP